MVIENLEFIKMSTSTIQGGGLKNCRPWRLKSSAIAHIRAIAKGIKTEVSTCVKTVAIADHTKIGAAFNCDLFARAKS